jgi:hypothetical protein
MTPQEEIIRAGHAREILDSALFKEAREHITAQINAQMAKVPISDQTMHTRLIMMLQTWAALQGWFEQVAETGKLAKVQIEQEERRRLFRFPGAA